MPVNGIRYGKDLAIGSVVWFGCEPGYRLSHEEQLVCEENHWWSRPLPTCDGELLLNINQTLDSLNGFIGQNSECCISATVTDMKLGLFLTYVSVKYRRFLE